ncbi:hypothetical protein I79_005597 [Cricetulus griseus]|uniref:Uncharacterized protein n=1 Tax=Cricetulus griseus TaxID=10029 RepID=G3H5L4_CRIGR|nr:hypothetical protein I79_005597 [Cricetulus griseus]
MNMLYSLKMFKKDSTGKRLHLGKSFDTDVWCGYSVTLSTHHAHALCGINYMKNTTLSNWFVYGVLGNQTKSLV